LREIENVHAIVDKLNMVTRFLVIFNMNYF
jgi:hypothetical protein